MNAKCQTVVCICMYVCNRHATGCSCSGETVLPIGTPQGVPVVGWQAGIRDCSCVFSFYIISFDNFGFLKSSESIYSDN